MTVVITLVDRAIALATRAHEGQFRKGGNRPYITHPLDVLERLRRHGIADEATLAAAVLHDVVEDCGVTVDRLEAEFGIDIANVVAEVTDPPGVSKTKAKKIQIEKAPSMSTRAKLVKLADKTSNLCDIVENPPGWARDSVVGYTHSAILVVNALGLNETAYGGLLAEFRAAAQRVLEAS